MDDLLGILIKSLDDGGFHYYQTGLVFKVLETIVMEHCNVLPTPTKI